MTEIEMHERSTSHQAACIPHSHCGDGVFERRLIRVVILDDAHGMADSLADRIEAQHDMALIAVLHSAAAAVETYQRLLPHVLLLFSPKTAANVTADLQTLRSGCPKSRVVVVTEQQEVRAAQLALRGGAAALVRIDTPTADMLSIIRGVYGGARHVPNELAVRLIEQISGTELTSREFQVLCHIRDGHRNKQIAHKLGIAEATVSFHIKNLTGKLQANDRTHAVMIALRRGLIQI